MACCLVFILEYLFTFFFVIYVCSGHYHLVSSKNGTETQGTRSTGDGKYTDKFTFSFSASEDGCVVEGCSESQVTSVVDYSTNFCNLYNLYCNTDDKCPIVYTDLTHSEKYTSCSQNDISQCTR